jgi:hypothetical protein
VFPGWKEKWKTSQFEDLAIRFYLRRSDRFMHDARRIAKSLAVGEERVSSQWGLEHYWRQTFPRYVWIAEFSSSKHPTFYDPGKYLIRGEMIIDSTAHPSALFNTLLSMRLAGTMAYRDPESSRTEASYSPPWLRRGRRKGPRWATVTGLTDLYGSFLV